MKECFETHNFQPAVLSIIKQADRILTEYRKEGYDLTVRQLYYRFIALGLFPESWIDPVYNAKKGLAPDTINTIKNYMRLGQISTKGRMAGMLDWDAMVDRGRQTLALPHWTDPGDAIQALMQQFRIDKWEDQPIHVEVMVEKQALEGILERICNELDVPLTANKGYSSASFMYRKGKELANLIEDGKDVAIIYMGDHDPSGIDMDRDVLERLEVFGRLNEGLSLKRGALTMKQITTKNAPPNPAKTTDSRATEYIKKYGNESWEIDALEPRELASIVRHEVTALRDPDLWDAAVVREEAMLSELREFADKY